MKPAPKEFIRGLHNLRPRHRGCVATIGTFDGVHLGHRAILRQLTDAAEQHQPWPSYSSPNRTNTSPANGPRPG